MFCTNLNATDFLKAKTRAVMSFENRININCFLNYKRFIQVICLYENEYLGKYTF